MVDGWLVNGWMVGKDRTDPLIDAVLSEKEALALVGGVPNRTPSWPRKFRLKR